MARMRLSVVVLAALVGGGAVLPLLSSGCSSGSGSSGGTSSEGGSASGSSGGAATSSSGSSGGASTSGSSSGGSSDSSSSGAACAQYQTDASLTAPTVSFATDVLPIFEHSCGLSSSCHGDVTDVSERGLYLGCDIARSMSCTASNPGPTVYAGLVGAMASKPLETAMPFITPGDPTQSYLMHKMDDNLCVVTDCIANNAAVNAAEMMPPWCGVFMPYNLNLLDPATRDTIRRWIQQGAMDN